MTTLLAWLRIFRSSPPSRSRDFSMIASTKMVCQLPSPVPASATRYVSRAALTPLGVTSYSRIRKCLLPPSTSSPAASTISANALPPASSKPTSTPPTNFTNSSGAFEPCSTMLLSIRRLTNTMGLSLRRRDYGNGQGVSKISGDHYGKNPRGTSAQAQPGTASLFYARNHPVAPPSVHKGIAWNREGNEVEG